MKGNYIMTKTTLILSTALLSALVLSSIGGSYYVSSVKEVMTVDTTGKERRMKVQDGNTTYDNFVYTDQGVFVVQDSFWNLHFTSSSVWNDIPNEPATCDIVAVGLRVGFFSMFQNIISAECE